MRIEGSVAVITGAARGIGLALAQSLARAGAKVVLADILDETLRRAVLDLVAEGGAVAGLRADVTKDEDVARLMDFTIETFGAINVVVANAGIARDGLLVGRDAATGRIEHVLSSADFRAVIEVNLVGAFITFREAARRMAERGWPGVLVAMSSINKVGQPGQLNYASSKAAVALWPKLLAAEFHWSGLRNLRVVGLAPGYTGTPALQRTDPQTLATVLKDVPLGRLVETGELAATLAHVIENEALNGTTIEVSGGASFGPWQRAK